MLGGARLAGNWRGLGINVGLAYDDRLLADVEDRQILGLDDRTVVDLAQLGEESGRARSARASCATAPPCAAW